MNTRVLLLNKSCSQLQKPQYMIFCYTKDSLSIKHQMRYQNYKFGHRPIEGLHSDTPKARKTLQTQCYQYRRRTILYNCTNTTVWIHIYIYMCGEIFHHKHYCLRFNGSCISIYQYLFNESSLFIGFLFCIMYLFYVP